MAIQHIHTFLVHPSKNATATHQIGGAQVMLTGKLFNMLNHVYQNAERECTIGISFNQGADGTQTNPCRSLLLDYIINPSLPNGRAIANRLASYTTNRSGLGLVFLILGREGADHKIVLSRFPAHSAILAEEDQRNLNVEFLERVFMRSATSYKAVVYQHRSTVAGFWMGNAVDKQIDSREVEISTYWIKDFLDSDFRTTAAAGSRRLALAMKDTARKATDLDVKREIAAAVALSPGLNGQTLTVRQFIDRFGLSNGARDAIVSELKHPELIEERFQFDAPEFARQVPYRTVELNSGAILTAQAAEFDEVFTQEVVDAEVHEVRFSTTGIVVGEKLEKSK